MILKLRSETILPHSEIHSSVLRNLTISLVYNSMTMRTTGSIFITLISVMFVNIYAQIPNGSLTISVENNWGTDETFLKINNNATVGFDSSFDTLKSFCGTPGLPVIFTSFIGENLFYSTNQFPEQEVLLPLSIYTDSTGFHTISFSGIANFSNTSCIFLEDIFTGNIYNLSYSPVITFYLFDTTSVARFLLKAGAPLYIQGFDESCYSTNDGKINLAKNSTNLFDINCYNASGNIVAAQTDVYQIAILENLNAGLYIIETTDQLCGNRIDSITIFQPEEISAEFISSKDTIFLAENSTEIFFSNQSANATYYLWDFDGFGTSNLCNPSADFNIEGIYSVNMIAYQDSDCYASLNKNIHVISTASIETISADQINIQIENQQLIITTDHADRIEIRTITGQLVYSDSGFYFQSAIDLTGISNQVLIVTIFRGDLVTSKKIVL